jgi:hypothetical protein
VRGHNAYIRFDLEDFSTTGTSAWNGSSARVPTRSVGSIMPAQRVLRPGSVSSISTEVAISSGSLIWPKPYEVSETRGGQELLHRLLQRFDLATGLGVIGPRVLGLDAKANN